VAERRGVEPRLPSQVVRISNPLPYHPAHDPNVLLAESGRTRNPNVSLRSHRFQGESGVPVRFTLYYSEVL